MPISAGFSDRQAVSTRSTIARDRRSPAPFFETCADLVLGGERRLEGRQQRSGQPRLGIEGDEAGAVPGPDEPGDARQRHARQFAERRFEQAAIAAEQGAQHQTGGELARGTQVRDEFQRPVAALRLGIGWR